MRSFRLERRMRRGANVRPVIALSAVVMLTALFAVAAVARAASIVPFGGLGAGTAGMVLGPDGNFWVASEFSGQLVHVSLSGVVLGSLNVGTRPTGVANGPGGRVWVTVTGGAVPGEDRLVWIDAMAPAPQPVNVIQLVNGAPNPCGPRAIVSGGDNFMYFSVPTDYYTGPPFDTPCGGGDLLGRVPAIGTPGTADVQTFGGPGIGNVFDLAAKDDKLFAPDAASGLIRRFPLGSFPVADSSVSTSPGSGPQGVAADGAGNIWVAESDSGKIARFPAAQINGSVEQEFTPTGGTLTDPRGIVVGADGRIYVAGHRSHNIVRLNPDGSSFAFFDAPNSEPLQVVNGLDGDFWFTDNGNSRILRLISAAPRVSTGAAAATAATTALVGAVVNPRGNDTQVVFDYGPTTAYGLTSAPVTVAGGIDAVPAAAVLVGLRPSTVYHVRARASNAEGSATGADTTLTTPLGDADGDGVAAPADCNDNDRNIHPGAVDKPGDKIDQDCSGKDATFPVLSALVTFTYISAGHSALPLKISIARLRGGETAKIRCTGRRCPFKVKTYKKLKKGTRTFGRKLLRKRRLTPVSRLSVVVTRAGAIGTTAVLRVGRKKAPKVTRACIRPGAKKSSRCP